MDPISMQSVPARDPDQNQENNRTPRTRSALDLRLGGDSAAFVRLINALVRASRETMLVQKYRDACARARDTLRELDPKRKLDESETRAIVRKVDEILGLAPASGPRRDELGESPLTRQDLVMDLSLAPPTPAPSN